MLNNKKCRLISTFPASLFSRTTVKSKHFSPYKSHFEFPYHFSTDDIDASTCVSAIQNSGHLKSLIHGRIIHSLAIAAGFLELHTRMESLLINMYVKCGSILDALSMFAGMHDPCIFSFNYLIRLQDQVHEALHLYSRMINYCVLPNQVTYTSILSFYVSRTELLTGKQLHVTILHTRFSDDVIVGTALVNMYGKCGSLMNAERMFNSLENRNLVTWTTMISLYAHINNKDMALQMFFQLIHEGLIPNRVSYISILTACKFPLCEGNGRLVHTIILSNAEKPDVSVVNALINMYGNFGRLEEARKAFDQMIVRDVISWSTMIACYAQEARIKEALVLLKAMQDSGIKPNKVTFINLLCAFSSIAELNDARKIHKLIEDHGLELDASVANAIISMYGRCGSLDDATKMFHKIPNKATDSWNSFIGAYSGRGELKSALGIFVEMQKTGANPDAYSFIVLLTACTATNALDEGRKLHACIAECGLEDCLDICGALINMYGKCGNLEDAQFIFTSMPEQNLVSWNCIIGAHVQHGHARVSLELFSKMRQGGFTPDNVTLVNLINGCACSKSLVEGRKIHKFLIDNGYVVDELLGSALINMYGKSGNLQDAREVFDNIVMPKVISWTAMMNVLAEHGNTISALKLFSNMLVKNITPDQIAFMTIIPACADLSTLTDGRILHGILVESGLDTTVGVGNAILNMYGKLGSVFDAWMLFSKFPEHDIISWNSMLAVYADHGYGHETLELFNRMKYEEVLPDKITFIIFITACSRAGMTDEACQLFMSMSMDYEILPVEDHYISLIDLLGRSGHIDTAKELIQDMPLQPSTVPYTVLLFACQYDFEMSRNEVIGKSIIELDPGDAAPYILLSNIHASISCPVKGEVL